MSTGLIIVIVVAALILLAVLVLLPRMRAKAQEAKREREISQRRDQAVDTHRSVAQERMSEAERLEAEARARKAEAEMHGEHAELHARGLADDKLVRDDERDLAEHVDQSKLDRDRDGRLDAGDLRPGQTQDRGVTGADDPTRRP